MENPYALARGQAERSPEFIDLIDTNFHSCGFPFPAPRLHRAARRYFRRHSLRHYSPDPAGDSRLRTVIADYYRKAGLAAHADQVVITASASESYSHVFASHCAPGDRIVLPRPSYPLFEEVALRHGVHVDFYEQRSDHGWRLDVDRLAAEITPDTRGIVLITPNNPTGHIADSDEINRILELCNRHALFLIVDEVFSGIIFRPGPLTRPASLSSDVVIFTLNGVSKLFASPDLKVSWILVTGPEERRIGAIEALQIQNDLFLSASPLTQHLVIHLFEAGWGFTESMRDVIAERRAVALEVLGEISGLRTIPPGGGIHLPLLLDPALLTGNTDDEEIAVRLLARYRVAVHPGYLYGFAEPALVMSYLPPASRLRPGIERIARCLGDLRSSAAAQGQ